MPSQQLHGLVTPPEPLPSIKAINGYFESSYDHNKASDLNLPQRLDVRLQFSNLVDSLQSAAIIDDKGFWNGQKEDENLRLELMNMCLKLQGMLSTPIDIIQNIAQAHHVEAALRYANHHKLAQHVPVTNTNTITYRDLATQASVNENQCRRIMRLLISHSIFSEPSPNTISHTPASVALLDPNMQSWIDYSTTSSIKASTHLTEALQKFPASHDPSETAYSLAHDTHLPMFEHINLTPGKLTAFRQAMIAMSQQPSVGAGHATTAYPWSTLPPTATVIDVGGGRGHVSKAIHDLVPSLDITVQDIGVTTPHSQDGVKFAPYDFFQPQPVKGANVYFLRQVFHDWPHEFAVEILKNQVMAMGGESKLVVMDIVMPGPGEWSLLEERRSRTTDVTMMTLFNAKERDMADWLALVEDADPRLRLTHFARPAGSLMSVMEFSLCTSS